MLNKIFITLFSATALLASSLALAEPRVARAIFTSGIDNREPVDALTSVSNDTNQLTFFTDLRDLTGQTVTHRWEYNGVVMAEIDFNVGAERWRVWSNKKLIPQWVGDWHVVVVDADNNELTRAQFTYTAME